MHRAIIVVVAAAAFACGGAVVDPGAGNAAGQAGNNAAGGGAGVGQGGGPGGSINPGTGGARPSCPVGQPTDGSSCVTEGLTCGYVLASCATCLCEYHCGNGQWVKDSTGCEPTPPPPPPMVPCPRDRPSDATYCLGAPADGCTYIASYCEGKPNGWATYYCVRNVWKGAGAVIERCDPTFDVYVPPPDVIIRPIDAGPDRIAEPFDVIVFDAGPLPDSSFGPDE